MGREQPGGFLLTSAGGIFEHVMPLYEGSCIDRVLRERLMPWSALNFGFITVITNINNGLIKDAVI